MKSAVEFERVWRAMTMGEEEMRALTPALTFDRLMHVLSSFHVLHALPSADTEPYIRFSCSCRRCQDRGGCKHTLREGIRAKLFSVPEDMQLGIIGREAKAGRRAKTTKPGLLQPGEEATLGGQVGEGTDRSTAEPEESEPEAEAQAEALLETEDPWVNYCKDE